MPAPHGAGPATAARFGRIMRTVTNISSKQFALSADCLFALIRYLEIFQMFGSEEQFRTCHRGRRQAALDAFLATLQPDLLALVKRAIHKDVADLQLVLR